MAEPLRRTLSKLRGRRSQRGAAGAAAQRHGGGCAPHADLIENVYIASRSRREPQAARAGEAAEPRPQMNSITVSKKRNWLHQSTHRAARAEDDDACGTTQGALVPAPASPSPVSEPKTQALPSRSPVGPESPASPCSAASAVPSTASVPRSCALDLSEDNDADDEGEIWYNPIPEDEEPELPGAGGADRWGASRGFPGSRPEGPASRGGAAPEHAQPPRPAGRSGAALEDCAAAKRPSPESCGHRAVAPDLPDSSLENSLLMLATSACVCQQEVEVVERSWEADTKENTGCRYSQERSGVMLAPKADVPPAEISPPSPSPLKKGGSINWPFPDKIKSPRTVRKLSMKMKKLPELSRKLSVKGASSHSSSDNPSSLPKGKCRDTSHAAALSSSGNSAAAASRNVISRYHLDSSVSSQHTYKKKSTRRSKSASKGGYLSDGDSPELITKAGKHGHEAKLGKGKEALPSNGSKTEIDIDAFRHYNFSDQPKCSQYISGLMSIHFYGAEDLKPPRIDSKDVFCAIQVDSVNKARTALLTCRTTFLDMDHTFNIEIENAQHLKLVVFSWEPTPRKNRVCCHGTVVLPTLFRVTKTHQLAVKLEPRGLIYVKLSLMEQWENSLDGLDANREPVMFGVDARKVVEKENAGLMVPLLMQKCILEIEKRGCQVVGLYRLCGSAAVKKELREAFERDSKAVSLCENQYPDVNVITGVLKDYLRELPSPLITKELYEAVLDAMAKTPLKMTAGGCENEPGDSEHTAALLDCLPDVERATLKMLLDHLKLVASYHEVNKMTCQNLAVCFGPVLLSQRQETSNHNNRVFTDSEELASALDFKKHIEVLHYLLQLWPVHRSPARAPAHLDAFPEPPAALHYLRPKKPRPHVLNLSGAEMAGVLRPRPAGLDSPSSNRYAGDWSSCGENYFLSSAKESPEEADYDDVPSEDTESGEESGRADGAAHRGGRPQPPAPGRAFRSYLTMQALDSAAEHTANLKDLQESIDILIGNLERELNKNKLNLSY